MTDIEFVLVGCVKLKHDRPLPARSLYKSPLFKKRKAVAEARGDGWGILSAEHGYVDPATELAPYDTHISDVDSEAWANAVVADLVPVLEDHGVGQVTILAGSKYVEPIEPELEHRGYEVFTPCAGLRPGERQSRLKTMLNQQLTE